MPSAKKFILHCIISGLLIFVFVGLFLNVSELQIFEILNPIEETLSDMEISDLAVSQIRQSPKPDTNITVVNIGVLDRQGIADQIQIISFFKPRALGVDVMFLNPGEDTIANKSLEQALLGVENLVMASRLVENDEGDIIGIDESITPFISNAEVGFANLDTEAVRQEDFKTCRNFPPARDFNGYHEAFAVKLAKHLPVNHVEELRSRAKAFEPINFLGNSADFLGASNQGSMFNTIDWKDLLTMNFDPSLIRDKIVILGFMGKDFTDTSWEDRFYTPMNKKYVGKTNPDMYGVIIHANIVSMLGRGDFIDEVSDSEGFGVIIAIMVCLFNMALFSFIHFRIPKWYDGLTKLIQLFELLLVLFFIVWSFHLFHLKFSLLLSILVIVLSGDLLEVYYSFITNLFRKLKEWVKVIRVIFQREGLPFLD